jgi:diguanylate cyclase (GGDEF)-like protein
MARTVRRKQIMAVMMLDLDRFKRFNDTHGHAAGDAALKGIAEIFNSNIRADDIACRYGGEEFTIILPDTTVEGACDRAENIVRAVSQLQIQMGKDTFSNFTISIGLAFFPGDGATSDLLLQSADTALYRAKREGRNRVCLFETAFTQK